MIRDIVFMCPCIVLPDVCVCVGVEEEEEKG
jgi:hypothetical protein